VGAGEAAAEAEAAAEVAATPAAAPRRECQGYRGYLTPTQMLGSKRVYVAGSMWCLPVHMAASYAKVTCVHIYSTNRQEGQLEKFCESRMLGTTG
jgi:hypothetical protein